MTPHHIPSPYCHHHQAHTQWQKGGSKCLREQKEWFEMPNKISLMWDFKRLQQLYREDNYLVIIEIDCEKLWGIVVQL